MIFLSWASGRWTKRTPSAKLMASMRLNLPTPFAKKGPMDRLVRLYYGGSVIEQNGSHFEGMNIKQPVFGSKPSLEEAVRRTRMCWGWSNESVCKVDMMLVLICFSLSLIYVIMPRHPIFYLAMLIIMLKCEMQCLRGSFCMPFMHMFRGSPT
uniref:Uncharacterized protein n=1 Tax=Leersia perrieri TaxID=77586 RepID=A0A0D9XXB8_9ORYZ